MRRTGISGLPGGVGFVGGWGRGRAGGFDASRAVGAGLGGRKRAREFIAVFGLNVCVLVLLECVTVIVPAGNTSVSTVAPV
jgi:hypothetical protein